MCIYVGDNAATAMVSRDCCCGCGDHSNIALLSQMYVGVSGEKKQDLFFNKLLSIGTVIPVHCGRLFFCRMDELYADMNNIYKCNYM